MRFILFTASTPADRKCDGGGQNKAIHIGNKEMNYRVKLAVLERTPTLEISEPEFMALGQSRASLVEALAMEEKYAILLTNYLAIEREILTQAANGLVRSSAEYFDFFEVRHSINVCVVNFLSSARMYVDQIPRHVRDCVGREAAVREVKAMLSEEYDSHREYRFMEALRNHAQHNATPIHKISSGSKWLGRPDDKNEHLEYRMALVASKLRLSQDKKFSKRVLAECDDEIDVTIATRRYVSCIGIVHELCRKYVKARVDSSRSAVEAVHARYAALNENEWRTLVGLEAQKVIDDKVVDRFPLLLDWDDVRVKLEKRNMAHPNLHRAYVSGKSSRSK